MPEFTADTYRVLIVEDRPEWRRALNAMYCRILYGKDQVCHNIVLAATAEDAVKLIAEQPQCFNLVSLDINLGSRESLGIANAKTKVAVTGLDVLDQVKKLQRGAAVLAITGASSDSELPRAFVEGDKDGIARARITLGSELQAEFEGAHRLFPKAPPDEIDVQKQVAIIERQLPRTLLYALSELREKQLVEVALPSLCLMIVLDDAYFEGHDETGSLFSDARHRVVRFDFLEESLEYLSRVKIWSSWPDPGEFHNSESWMSAWRTHYYQEAQTAFDTAVRASSGYLVLRSKPDSMPRCAPPKNTTTIGFDGKPKMTDVHKEFLLSVARSKIVNSSGGPLVGNGNDKKSASEIRKRLRDAFQCKRTPA
jgi:CheY-like chemotaxis protein